MTKRLRATWSRPRASAASSYQTAHRSYQTAHRSMPRHAPALREPAKSATKRTTLRITLRITLVYAALKYIDYLASSMAEGGDPFRTAPGLLEGATEARSSTMTEPKARDYSETLF